MRKIFLCMLVWVGIVFDVGGMSRVRELSKKAIFNKKPVSLNLSDKTKQEIKSFHIKDNVERIAGKHADKLDLYVYDKDSGAGVWFDQRAIAMSEFLKKARYFKHISKQNLALEVQARELIIQKIFNILSNCAASQSEDKYLDIIRKQTEGLNFDELLSTFDLAWNFFIEQKVLNKLVVVTQEKMTDLFKEKISFSEKDFIILEKITQDQNESISLFPDKKFDNLLEVIKKDIRQQFLCNTISNEKIFYKTDALVLRGYEVSHLSLNKNGSRVWYTYSEKNSPGDLGLYGLNIKDLSQIFTVPRIIQKPPCWVDGGTIAYIQFVSSGENQAHKLILHDCVTNKDISRIMNAKSKQELIQKFNPLQLLCGGRKIMFLYFHSGGCGVGIGDFPTGVIKHSDLYIKNSVRLLPIKDGYFSCVSYDHSGKEISLYKGDIREDNFLENVRLENTIDIVDISEEIFSRGIINSDGSKMAFIIGNEICLLSFNNLKTDRFRCEGVDDVSAIAFSPDDELLMIAANKEVIVFDLIEKEIIHELSVRKAEAFDNNDSMAFSEDGKFFAVAGHSENRDEFLMMTTLESDQDLKKLYLNVVNEMVKEKEEFPFGERVFLYLLSLRSKSQEKLEPLTNVEKEIFQSLDEDIQEVLTEIKYVAPGQMSEELRLGKKNKLPTPFLTSEEKNAVKPPLAEEKKSPLRSFLEKAWQASSNYWNSWMRYFPSSG